jgi:uncharacterized membrane protein YoaT (DUF817 family)
MKKSKTLINAFLALTTLILTAFFWSNALLLLPLLFIIAIGMIALENEKRAVIIWLVGFVFGPISEIVMINVGAWNYTDPYIFGIPLWLPFIWGNASLFLNRLNAYTSSVTTHKLQ